MFTRKELRELTTLLHHACANTRLVKIYAPESLTQDELERMEAMFNRCSDEFAKALMADGIADVTAA